MTADERVVPRVCGLCESACGLLIHVRGTEVIKVRGNPDDVLSRGFICPKGASHGALAADPDRLRQPMIRVGGRLQETTWDEAFAVVADRLAQVRSAHGAGAVAAYRGNPTAYSLARPYIARLTAAVAPNVYSAMTADAAPMLTACAALFGNPAAVPVPDLDRTDLLVVLGANPLESNGSICTAPDFPGRLRALRSRGGRLVVIDPRATATAKAADVHLPIFPGTDSFLLLALLHQLMRRSPALPCPAGVSPDHLQQLRELTRPFSPTAVSRVTSVDGEHIRALADDIATAARCAVYGRIGVSTVENASVASWLIQVVNIVTGNLDRPGGAMFPRQPTRPTYQVDRPHAPGARRSRVRGLNEVMGEFPMATLADEILGEGSGQIRALITIAGNPGRSAPNGRRMAEALASLDLLVCVDPYLNETTRHADIILPPPPGLTSHHYDWLLNGMAVRAVLRYSRPALDLPPDGMSEVDIISQLVLILDDRDASPDQWRRELVDEVVADAVSQPASPVFGRSPEHVAGMVEGDDEVERYLDLLLRLGPHGDGFGARESGTSLSRLKERPEGIDHGPMEPRLHEVVLNDEGLINLVPVRLLEEAEKLVPRRDVDQHELVLIGRRDLRSNNSWMHNIPQLVAGKDSCTLLMNVHDAADLGIGFGEIVTLVGPTGEVDVMAEITHDIKRGVVSLPHGWGHPVIPDGQTVAAATRGVSVNDLLDDHVLDALSGNAVFSGVPVTVRKAGRAPRRP